MNPEDKQAYLNLAREIALSISKRVAWRIRFEGENYCQRLFIAAGSPWPVRFDDEGPVYVTGVCICILPPSSIKQIVRKPLFRDSRPVFDAISAMNPSQIPTHGPPEIPTDSRAEFTEIVRMGVTTAAERMALELILGKKVGRGQSVPMPHCEATSRG